MNEKKDKPDKTLFFQIAQLPFVQGPILGTTVMFLVTPGLNWTNHVMDNKKMIWGNALSGSFVYASSAVPSYGMVFGIRTLLDWAVPENSPCSVMLKSFFAGAASGAIGTPFDAITQNKALAKLGSSRETCALMTQHHGYTSFFQGACVTMFREGVWATIYLAAVPAVAKYYESKGMNRRQAEATALVLTAGTYGLFSTPLAQLRLRKQIGLTKDKPNKSYVQHAKDIWQQEPSASISRRIGFFFKGGLPRTATVTIAGGLLVKGKEYYDSLIKSAKI